jgi:hypothetical protein
MLGLCFLVRLVNLLQVKWPPILSYTTQVKLLSHPYSNGDFLRLFKHPLGYLVTTQDFIKFWGKFFASVLLEMIEIHRDLKLLSLIESFIRKYTKPSFILLKDFLEKGQVSKYYFLLFTQTYAS